MELENFGPWEILIVGASLFGGLLYFFKSVWENLKFIVNAILKKKQP